MITIFFFEIMTLGFWERNFDEYWQPTLFVNDNETIVLILIYFET